MLYLLVNIHSITPRTGLENLTSASGITIFNIMNTQNQSNIDALESKIEELLTLTQKLSAENTDLKEQMQTIRSDRAQLIEQKERARSQVESMITRLKTVETA